MINSSTRKKLGAFITLGLATLSLPAGAQVFSLPQLPDTATVERVSNVLASMMETRTVEPPSEPGRFGFGFGVAGWVATTAQISSLIGSNSLPVVPFANPYVTLYGPLGITLDVAGIPPLTIYGTRLYNLGGNLRWTFTRLMSDWFPLNIALNLSLTNSGVNYSQILNSVNITVNANTMQIGVDAIVSKELLFFEPYLALGFTNQSSTISYTGSQPLFSFTTGNSVNVSNMSFHTRAGFQIRALVLVFGAEYEYAYGNHSGAAKVGFKI